MHVERIAWLDALRGLAILLMVVYHLLFDLEYLGIADTAIGSLPLMIFQRSIGTLFLLLVGISLTVSESRNKEGYGKYVKRASGLFAVALIISLATWIYPHEGFIKFGIIHLIAVSVLIAPFFFRLGPLNLVAGALIILAGSYFNSFYVDADYLFWLGLISKNYFALDHYPIAPWFGIVLFGIYAGSKALPAGNDMVMPRISHFGLLEFLGRHSLAIYLIHQPILIGILFALGRIM